jgi:beta-phosphoglucomutase-like phosphatase (HAD superfamily)
MPLRAVIFDFDGVLVDSEPLHYRALRDSLSADGISISPEEYAREYLAYADRECIRIAFERHGVAHDGEAIEATSRRKARIFDALLGEVPFFEGARELVAELSRTVPLAIASGALTYEIERILNAGGLRAPFFTVVGADDVSRGKPHPEPYLVAMERLRAPVPDLSPADCLVFEDSVAGIAAGLAAGMKVIGVAQSYPPSKLQSAHRVIPSLKDVDMASLHDLFERASDRDTLRSA